MYQQILRFSVIVSIALLSACASVPSIDPDDSSRSVVFGYIDMDEASTSVDWAYLKGYGNDSEGYYLRVEDGYLVHVAVAPGPYQVTEFGGSGFLAGDVVYSFPDSGKNETAITVKKPSAYFLGSYEFVDVDTGFFEQDKFDIKPVKKPSEKEVLQKVITIMQDEFPEYKHAMQLVQRRLKVLR